MATPSEWFKAALEEIGYHAAGETLNADDAEKCRLKLNLMLGQWRTRRSFVYAIQTNEYTFGASQQTYTIGPSGADFTQARPVRIEGAALVLTASNPDVYIPLEVINWKEHEALHIPALSATLPVKLYYQPTKPNGTLYPWPYPTVTSNKLRLTTWVQITDVARADVDTDYTLPDGYENAIMLSLSESLCMPFGVERRGELVKDAAQARQDIKALNIASNRIGTADVGLSGQDRSNTFNYLTGTPR